MTDVTEDLKRLDAITAQLKTLDEKREALRDEGAELVVALLKADVPPTEVARRGPFSDAHTRTLARMAGLPPARKGKR